MSDETKDAEEAPEGRKRGPLGLILVLVLALAAGGGAFFAAWSGMLPFGKHAEAMDGATEGQGDPDATETAGDRGDDHASGDGNGGGHDDGHGGRAARASGAPSFVTLPPIAVSVGAGGSDRQLRVQPVLEVEADAVAAVTALEPRLQDMLLGYLRALDPSVLEDPIALLRMRAQMLRRARMVTADAGLGDHAVADLLVTDFVLN